MFLANIFSSSDVEDNTSRPMSRGGIADFFVVEKTTRNFLKVPRATFVGSIISTCKFNSFKNPFATNTSLPELYIGFKSFIPLVKMKKVISMNYGSNTNI